jgi:putative membrane protein
MANILSTIVTIAILAWIVPGVSYGSWITLIIAGVVLALLDMLVRPILKLLFLPINIVTLGFFGWVINVFILWLATYLVPGFQIINLTVLGIALNQFFSLLLISSLISLIHGFVRIFIK